MRDLPSSLAIILAPVALLAVAIATNKKLPVRRHVYVRTAVLDVIVAVFVLLAVRYVGKTTDAIAIA